MLSYILAVVLVVLYWAVYVLILKPKRQLDNYVRLFQAKGFKVYKYPFKAMGSPAVQFWQQKQKGDDVLTILKQEYPQYDVVISNFVHNVMIELINPNLLKSFYSLEGVELYFKMKNINDPMKRVMGEGLLTSEADSWKKKRSIMSRVFNFDLIKRQTYKVADICDFSIQQVEKSSSTKTTEEGEK